MLLKELVEQKHVSFHHSFSNWEEAVRASMLPFIEDGSINDEYIESVVNCVKKYGPYIVLAPHIAMPHAQEQAMGVFRTGICFMKVDVPVEFEPGNPEKNAELFFSLAASNHQEHLEQMQKLATLLLQTEAVEELLACRSEEDLLDFDKELEDMEA